MNLLVEKYVTWNSVLSLFTKAIRPLMDCKKKYIDLAQRSKVIPGKLIVPQLDTFSTLYGI